MAKDMARPAPVFAGRFASNPDFDFAVRGTLGGVAGGGADAGEVLAAVGDVKAKDHDGWFAAWKGLGDRTRAAGDEAAASGHRVTASGAYLRAANYLGRAVSAVAGLVDATELLPTFRSHRDAWERFTETTAVQVERVDVPYEGTALPGWFFRAPAADPARPGPVLVVNLGSDESISAAWTNVGPDALARGMHVFVFDGPGQQSMLFEHDVPFRPDWEAVLTPVVDVLVGRDDVDPDALLVWGVSQAGYWVPRALATEHRFAAAVADPGVVDVSTSWERHVPSSLLKLLDHGEREKFDRDMALGFKLSPETAREWRFRARPYGGTGYADVLEKVRDYRLDADLGAAVRTPLLVTAPDHEQFWPGQSDALAQLTAGVSTLMPFTAAEGADVHCEPLAHHVRNGRVFDWLEDRLRAVNPAAQTAARAV